MNPGPTQASGQARGAAPPVALVGFMGAGKSDIGRRLAAWLEVPFHDSDDVIEHHHGSIADIFEVHGEGAFRQIERDEVVALVDRIVAQPGVLALGGGAVLGGDVRDALARLPHVVWLTAPAEVLWKRIRAASQQVRPLATDEHAFERLLAERSALYASVATLQVDNDGSEPPEQVAERVAMMLTSSTGHRRVPAGEP